MKTNFPELAKRLETVETVPTRAAPLFSPLKQGVNEKVRTRHFSERGIALVITLILLSVITFMAIAFLVISRADRNVVTTQTDQTLARLGADTAQQRAVAELLSRIMATTNEFNIGLLVPTNYISGAGFIASGPGYATPTNVSYNYPNGSNVTGNDALQNLANLWWDPRPPVFVTNKLYGSNEFRFYLDLNRNGQYDRTGISVVTNAQGQPVLDANSFSITNFFNGDPEYIGVMARPDFPHSVSNQFVQRYTYIVVPAAQTLDINYLFNQAKLRGPAGNYYFRNEGVGTWEINLAAFLVDLNTNMWPFPQANALGFQPYFYNTNFSDPPGPRTLSTGAAFDDATSLLRYRYSVPGQNGNYNRLSSVSALYTNGPNAFRNDGIDGYSDGLLMTSFFLPPEPLAFENPSRVWVGADNPAHYFTTQEFFDPAKVNPLNSVYAFHNRLFMAGTNVSSYDRYTYYRLLAQLGTDSAPEPPGKMNVNYDNLVQANPVTGAKSATNFYAWHPIDFFNNAATRLLANAGYACDGGYANILTNSFGVTNFHIQIYPTNLYTASVHRLLQLAANMYDATTNQSLGVVSASNGFPSVFRPLFYSPDGGAHIFITGYQEETTAAMAGVGGSPPVMRDMSVPGDRALLGRTDMVYGIPLVIGARKGFPNFNELAMHTDVQVTRKLEFLRPPVTGNPPAWVPVDRTNQMYLMTISNAFGVEAWNSYSNAFPRRLQIVAAADMRATITDELTNMVLYPPNGVLTNYVTNFVIAPNTWSGFNDIRGAQYIKYSFQVPLTNVFFFLTNSTFRFSPSRFVTPYESLFNEPPNQFPVPRWWLNLRTRLRFILVDLDANPNRIVDYVNLASTEDPVDLTEALTKEGVCNDTYRQDASRGSMWCTNREARSANLAVPTYGIRNQMGVCLDPTIVDAVWNTGLEELPPGLTRAGAVAYFKYNLTGTNTPGFTFTPAGRFSAPFQPTRKIFVYTSWQANDPLVHYTIGDLSLQNRTNRFEVDTPVSSTIRNIGAVNGRYEPWGGSRFGANDPNTITNLALKDPLVTHSDDYEFPTNKLPNPGWLGRIHRGTPWQTVYLKSPPVETNQWRKWSGNGQIITNIGQFQTNVVALHTGGYLGLAGDFLFTQPQNDYAMLELFTTALNDNASRGQLPINQTNLAAWSAVLSGVIVNSNVNADAFSIIDPAGVYDPSNTNTWPPVVKIVAGINRTRSDTNLFPRQVFSRLGDILATPELTVASPYLNTNTPALLSDAVYERIPQQILGLLKLDPAPRFVIYSYGQALKPADRSVVTSGKYFGMVTNYQITAEVATRTVVRIEGVQTNPHSTTNLHAVIESFNVLPPD